MKYQPLFNIAIFWKISLKVLSFDVMNDTISSAQKKIYKNVEICTMCVTNIVKNWICL